MNITPSMAQNSRYTRLHYVRYADDFIIGVEGSLDQTREILEKVTKFIEEELQLKFNPDKTGITDYSKEPIEFLGYTISAPFLKGSEKPMEILKVGDKKIKRRKKTRIKIHMDKMKVLSKLTARGMVRKRTSHTNHDQIVFRGKFMGNLINMDHADIIKYYNSVIRGIHNYYDFVDNRNDLLHII